MLTFKYFSKILAKRMHCTMETVVQKHQRARQENRVSGGHQLSSRPIPRSYRNIWAAYFIFLNYQKALDSVNHRGLYEVTAAISFPSTFIYLIQNFNSNAQLLVIDNRFKTLPFKLYKSMR